VFSGALTGATDTCFRGVGYVGQIGPVLSEGINKKNPKIEAKLMKSL